ncbi:ABC transporter ATP-binding protein [Pseudonocardiaceae bacterium YIM PH 21723]|nr:ABC transporter ATP-binding protein [Pseudonocardiaceae bacterium YIM PH 21723]
MGIIGENGAGKTTLLRILAGELRSDHGDVMHSGKLGYCPQRIVLNKELTVEQHLRYFQQAYRARNLGIAYEMMDRLNFSSYRRTRTGELSGGTQQKLNLTLALMHDPDVVLMDEPYQGFDWENYLNFWKIADELRSRGCSVLIISHIAHDTNRFDRLLYLRGGVMSAAKSGPVDLPVQRLEKAVP